MANVSVGAGAAGALVSWEEGIGDDKKYHVAHVSPAGMTLVRKMKDYKKWVELVAEAKQAPAEAAGILQKVPNSAFFERAGLEKVTCAQKLNQLTLFDRNGQKTKIPEGKEQADVFAAIKSHFGGSEGEEEADAWSVMQSPLFALAVFGSIGGFFIWFTTICEPTYEATGRKSGMKNLLNWVGYKIGPMWMSIAVGSFCALILASMISQLIKRPVRQVLTFTS